MSIINNNAVNSVPLFHRTGVRGQTIPGYGGAVTYGGAHEAAGEVTHRDRASGYDNLTVFVSGVMTFLDCVGVILVIITACMMAFVVSTFSLVLVGSKGAGAGFFELVSLVFDLMNTSVYRAAIVLGYLESVFVGRPFVFPNFLQIVLSRVLSVVLSELLAPRSTRGLSVVLKVGLFATSFITVVYSVDTSKCSALTSGLQVLSFTLADLGMVMDPNVLYLVALATLFVRPLPVILVSLICYKFGWLGGVGKRALAAKVKGFHFGSVGTNLGNYGTKWRNRSLQFRRMDKISREFVKNLAIYTNLYAPKALEYATAQQWYAFGKTDVPSDMDKCLRGIALYGDREMASMLARVGLRDGLDVQECSDLSQKLLTNAAFAKYFDVKLSKMFPCMRYATEKRKGTFVEALVGAAAMESGSYAAVERFVMVDVRAVVGV